MRLWPRAFCTISAALIPACGLAGADSQLQTLQLQVKAAEQRWLDNENRPDVLQSILGDDFVHVLPIGFISKGEQLAYVREHPNAFTGMKRFDALQVRIYGTVAIATGILSTVHDSGDKPKRIAFTDVFVRRAGIWQAVNAQELPLEPAPMPAS